MNLALLVVLYYLIMAVLFGFNCFFISRAVDANVFFSVLLAVGVGALWPIFNLAGVYASAMEKIQ